MYKVMGFGHDKHYAIFLKPNCLDQKNKSAQSIYVMMKKIMYKQNK